MQVDVILDPRLPATEVARLGLLCESTGIGAVWLSSLPGARDPFVNLTPLAAATARLRVGAIAVNPFEAHPGRIAASLLTLNEVAAGRAAIVLGGGGEALAALGIAPARRVRAVREAYEILQLCARQPRQRFDYAGELFRTSGYGCLWGAASAPQVWIAANEPQMLRMAGGLQADIMMSDLPAQLVRAAIGRYRAAGGAADARCSNFVAWHVYDDLARARQEAQQWLAFRGMFRRWVCTTFMSDADFDLIAARQADFYRAASGGPAVQGMPARLLDALIDHLTIVGSTHAPDGALSHLHALKDAGLTHVALRLYQDVEQSIAFLGRVVIPSLRT